MAIERQPTDSREQNGGPNDGEGSIEFTKVVEVDWTPVMTFRAEISHRAGTVDSGLVSKVLETSRFKTASIGR